MSQELTPHIDHAISPKAHTPMYLVHKFWARKPHNVVGEYIAHYSKKGDIVLDPFVGSGVTAIEALKQGRKAIAIDIDPIATFITKLTLKPISIEKFREAFQKIEDSVKDQIQDFHRMKCPDCGKEALEAYVIWSDVYQCSVCNRKLLFTDLEVKKKKYYCPCGTLININNFVDEEPIEIGYNCETCLAKSKKRVRFLIKKESIEEDKKRFAEFDKMSIPYWVPRDVKLEYPNGNPFQEGTHQGRRNTMEALFTRRNLIALSILLHEIEKIKDTDIKDLMKLVFTSNLHNVSKLNPVHQPRWRKGQHPSTSWIVHRYWVPPLRVELPIWFYFKERFEHILEGKRESNEAILYKEAKTFDDLKKGANIMLCTKSALNLLETSAKIPKNTVDYVFTDPPYGGSIQYMELSLLWISWLKGKNNDLRFEMSFDQEITINDSQQKDFETYHRMLRNSFEQIFEVLKAGKWLTVTFHNTKIKIFNSIIKAVVLSGFDLEKIIYQPPARPSAKGLLQPYGSAVGDYYIRFRKPERKVALSESEIDKVRYQRIIINTVKNIIAERGEPTPYSIIINSYPEIYDALKKNGYLFSAPEGIGKILKRNVNKEFVLVDVKDKEGKTVGKKWWLKGVYFLDRAPLSERVEMVTIDVLNKRYTVSFDDVLEKIFTSFPNALTPDTQNVRDVLNRYARKTKDGKWTLESNVKKREQEHDKMVEMLAIIGEKVGFKVHADLLKWRKDVFPNVPLDSVKGIKKIDVVWFTKDRITHEFEVENTTGIWSAIIRGSNILDGEVERFIVIPEERLETFNNKINVPALRERIQKENWRFILYDKLKIFFHDTKRKKKVNVEELEKISQKPQLPKKTVETLELFTNPS